MPKITYTEAVAANLERSPEFLRPDPNIFSEFLTMKIIEQRRIQQFGSRYGANANGMGFAQKRELVRNLGVRIDALRLAELDAVTEFLGCNKQEFVMELLVSGLEKAKATAAEAGLTAVLDAVIDRKVEEAGFSIEPSPNEGYLALHFDGQPIINESANGQSGAQNSDKTT